MLNVELMTPAEVAAVFSVNPRTVTRWAKQGDLVAIRTPGNVRRYFRTEIQAILRGETLTDQQRDALKAGYVAQVLS